MTGYTLMHEHTTIDLSGVKQDADCRLDCYEQTREEYRHLYELGVRRIVDVTNDGMGRNPEYIARMEQETGISIVQSTGFYKEPFLPERVYQQTISELADWMVSELRDGIQGGPKARMIGEIGTSKNCMTEMEQKVFQAAAIAARETGAPIYTHTTLGTYALEQAEFFKAQGLPLDRIVLGHIDLSGDLDYIRRILDTGICIGFDTVGKNNYFPDEKRAEYLMELEREGRMGQIVLSEDLTRKSHLKEFGGIGYSYLFETFLPMLRAAGMKQESMDQMLIHNPARILGDA